MAEREVHAVEDLRQVELDRLDRLHSSLWCNAMQGDVQAALTLLRISEQRIRLLGLQAKADEHPGDLRPLVIGPTGCGLTPVE